MSSTLIAEDIFFKTGFYMGSNWYCIGCAVNITGLLITALKLSASIFIADRCSIITIDSLYTIKIILKEFS